MCPRAKVVLNPMADKGRAGKVANGLRVIAQSFEGRASRSQSDYPAHAVELAKQAAAEGCSRVIAMGGGGTAHDVVNALMQVPEEQRPVLGVAPLGSESGSADRHFDGNTYCQCHS